MTDTVFIDYTTPIPASWLNDVNGATYHGTGVNTPSGGITSTTQQAAINELDTKKAPLASPSFTGSPTAPTATPGTNTTQIATTAYVTAADTVIQNGISTTVSTALHSSPSKATPVDADELYLLDSASTFSLSKLTWSNLKATLVSYLSALTTTWAISTTGNAATATTIAGTAGTKLPQISCTQAGGALTFSASSLYLDYRSTTLTSGTVSTVFSAPANLVLPSGGTLGFPTTVQGRIIVVELLNAGVAELAIVSLAGGNDLSETGVISTTAISASATAANVFYSTTARTNVAYRVIGAVDVVNTAGAWGSPVLVQGAGGQALTAMSSMGYGQTWQSVTRTSGTTYYSLSNPITLMFNVPSSGTTFTLSINGVTIFSVPASGYPAFTAIIPPYSSYVITTGATISAVELR